MKTNNLKVVVGLKKCIGKDAQLIYIDRKRDVSIRNVRVLVVGEQRFKAYCYTAQAIRTFYNTGVVNIEVLSDGKQVNAQHVIGV